MLEIDEKVNYRLSENIFLYKIAELDKYWVFNIESGEHFSLNESSFWILEHIAEGRSSKRILGDFLATFDIDERRGKKDFTEIMEGFLKESIVEKEAEE